MNEKDRFDSCIKLAEFWAGRFDARREYEWKISLGFWGVLVAAIHYRSEILQVLPKSSFLLALTLILVFLLFLGVWLFPLWKRHYTDKKQEFHYLEQGERLFADPNHNTMAADFKKLQSEATLGKFLMDWAMLFHSGTTLALLLVFWRLVTARPCS
jgi:hypothetical protein